MEFRLSRSLLTNFSFTQWNFGYHGAFQELFFHTMEFWLSWSLSRTFLLHDGILAITEPFSNFHEFFLMMEFRLSGTFLKLSRIFSYDGVQAITEPLSNFHEFFLWWNSGYHGAFLKLSLIFSYDGIQAITEPFSNFHEFFLMMEPFTNFAFTRWNLGYNIALSWNFSFTLRNFGYHGALSWNHSPHLEILKTYKLGGGLLS
jgi:hypothetical protein